MSCTIVELSDFNEEEIPVLETSVALARDRSLGSMSWILYPFLRWEWSHLTGKRIKEFGKK